MENEGKVNFTCQTVGFRNLHTSVSTAHFKLYRTHSEMTLLFIYDFYFTVVVGLRRHYREVHGRTFQNFKMLEMWLRSGIECIELLIF
jgi:hypothetical protein